jgi:ribonuclease III
MAQPLGAGAEPRGRRGEGGRHGPLPPLLEAMARRLPRPIRDTELLARSVAHRSWCAETEGETSNERLEFLGDAVLGLVVTDHIYRTYPDLPEGELAKVRATVVSAAALAEVALEVDLGDALLLGKGEDASGGREKPSILADAIEAVIGAVYLDGGWDAAVELVLGLLGERIAGAAAGPGGQDYKTRLQELAARQFESLPAYRIEDDGPDHAKRFFATVALGGADRGRGVGRSKKQAEQAAARQAWERLRTTDAGDATAAPHPDTDVERDD